MRIIIISSLSLLLISNASAIAQSAAAKGSVDPATCSSMDLACRRAMKSTCTGQARVCIERRKELGSQKAGGDWDCEGRVPHCLKTGQWWHGDSKVWETVQKR